MYGIIHHLWIFLFLTGLLPFIFPIVLGLYTMTIESWILFDWLVLYSFVYWPTYLLGLIVIVISLVGIFKKEKC